MPRKKTRGTGTVYRRPGSRFWWVKVPLDGTYIHRSSRSEKQSDAIDLQKKLLGQIHRGERRGAGGIHRVVHATEIEAIRGVQTARGTLDALLEGRGVDIVTFRDWQNIDKAEIARARDGAPREKFVAVDDMIAAKKAAG